MPAAIPTLDALTAREAALVQQEGRTSFSLRMHRAISWLRRAEQEHEAGDADIAFICQWIAFNAAYAQELSGLSEKASFKQFIEKICALDAEKWLDGIIWRTYSGPIRTLLDNQYVFQTFWDAMNGKAPANGWKQALEQKCAQVRRGALSKQNTAHVLFETFTRLYTLRNQLMHGGATWQGRVNRPQVRDGSAILAHLLPAILAIMLGAPQQFQAPPFYPVVGEKN